MAQSNQNGIIVNGVNSGVNSSNNVTTSQAISSLSTIYATGAGVSASAMTGTTTVSGAGAFYAPYLPNSGVVFGTSGFDGHIMRINDADGKELVKLMNDGTVKWTDEDNVDEAAKSFARMLKLGVEASAKITNKVKLDMRDSVFNDIIEIAKMKGALTAEDLTHLLEASKIVEKLKGPKE